MGWSARVCAEGGSRSWARTYGAAISALYGAAIVLTGGTHSSTLALTLKPNPNPNPIERTGGTHSSTLALALTPTIERTGGTHSSTVSKVDSMLPVSSFFFLGKRESCISHLCSKRSPMNSAITCGGDAG